MEAEHLTALVARYLDGAEQAIGLLGDDPKALWMLRHTRALRSFLASIDATNRAAIEKAIVYTVVVEGMTNKALSNPIVEKFLAYAERQAERGRMGAKIKWSGAEREVLADAMKVLAARNDALGPVPPNELWPALYALLEEAGLQPEEKGGPQLDTQRYDFGSESLKYESFSRQIRRLRE